MEAEISDNSPVGETGQLKTSWRAELTATGVKVTSSAPHANFPEWGTRTPILPKPDNKAGGFLVFVYKGRKYVVRKVRGQRPQLYVFKALRTLFPTARINGHRHF